MSENTNIKKAAGIIGGATFLSRISGFIRDMVIAGLFGAGLSADAFFAAFRISNLFRRLFADGAMTVAFIPAFTRHLANHGKSEAFRFAFSAMKILSVFLGLVVVAGIFFSPLIVHIIAPGFVGIEKKFLLTVSLTRLMFPYLFFICMVALSMGILNSLGHFAGPAFAPLVLNIAIIGSVFVISPLLENPVTGLAIGVLIGGVLQLAIQAPFLRKKGFRITQKADFFHPELKTTGKLMIPAMFGAAVYQVNVLVDTLLGSWLSEGSVSYLYYADRLVQFPVGIIVASTATAVLPSLSRQALKKDLKELEQTLIRSLKLVLFITIPAMIGLIVLREPVVAILFERGAFDSQATLATGSAILYYGIGIWAFSGVRILVTGFYALQDTRTPCLIAGVSVLFNFVLSIILMRYSGHCGIALATSLASGLNLVLLVAAMHKYIRFPGVAGSVCKTLVCSLIMGAGVIMFSMFIISPKGLWGLIANIITGVMLFAGLSYLIMPCELRSVLSGFGNFKKIKKGSTTL